MKITRDEPTLVALLAIILAAVALWAMGCGGGGGSYSTPTTASTTTTAAGTVNIVGLAGSAAFSPNPVQVAPGATVAFKNTTGALHHLVMDDGTNIGDVAAGATTTTTLKGSGGNYHCTNHPTMVGSINGAAAPPDPTPNASGGYSY